MLRIDGVHILILYLAVYHSNNNIWRFIGVSEFTYSSVSIILLSTLISIQISLQRIRIRSSTK